MAVEISARGLSCHNCTETLKIFRGCDNKPKQDYLIDGKVAERCPAKIILPEIKDYIRYYSYYKKGHLPFRGGLSEQPIKLLQIFDILESEEADVMNEKYNKLHSKMTR